MRGKITTKGGAQPRRWIGWRIFGAVFPVWRGRECDCKCWQCEAEARGEDV